MELSKKLIWLLPLTLILGIFIFYFFDFHEMFTFEKILQNYIQFKEYSNKNLIYSYGIFSISYIFVVSFSIPIASTLTILGGMVFGWNAFFIIVFSATIGSIIVFIAAQTIANHFFKKKIFSFFNKLEKGFKKNDLLYLISLRLIPLIPFWVVNVIPAFFNMKIHSYILGTFVGIIPGTFVYVWISISVNTILISEERLDFLIYKDPSIIGSLTVLGLLVLLHTYSKKIHNSD